jgi:hypothetical protein
MRDILSDICVKRYQVASSSSAPTLPPKVNFREFNFPRTPVNKSPFSAGYRPPEYPLPYEQGGGCAYEARYEPRERSPAEAT